MTREEAISVLKVLASFQGVMEYLEQHSVSVQDACNMAISALKQNESAEEWYKLFVKKLDEQEPCDDAISRDAVMNEVKCWIGSGEYRYTNATDYLSKRIRELPSVTQKSGKWIYRRGDKYSCSKCGTTTRVDEGGIDEKPMYKFCPYCGAKMESEVNNG